MSVVPPTGSSMRAAATRSSTALTARARRLGARHASRGRIERAGVGFRRARARDSAARREPFSRSTSTHVRADAAVTINGLVRWTIMHGAAGLEAWAGTPGTVGGAIFGNAHFGGRLIGDLVSRGAPCRDRRLDGRRHGVRDGVRLRSQPPCRIPARSCCRRRFASRRAIRRRCGPWRGSRWRIGNAPSRSRRRAQAASFRIRRRAATRCPKGIPWSAGALVDRAGLKGLTMGGARVSRDTWELHRQRRLGDRDRYSPADRSIVATAVRDRFGVDLREEIVYLGDFRNQKV